MRARKLFGGLVLSALGLWLQARALELLQLPEVRAEDIAPKRPISTQPVLASERAEPVASYTLRARLDDRAHSIDGSAVLRWTNRSRAPARELWFHLYLNAFKNDQTLFLRSPFGAGRSGERPTDWGYTDVHKLTIDELGDANLWPSAAPHSPGDPLDQTDIRLPLPEPVAPGKTLTIRVAFRSKLPGIVERTGHSGRFHFVAQWFPKLARLEPDGSWAHFPFHAQSEFYADFGDYDVTIDVDQALAVAACGKVVSETVRAGRRIGHYRLDSAHDFAFSAWDQFRVRREQIDGVLVRVFYPQAHDENAEAALEALRFALPYFNRAYGRYPYPELTVVHPPQAAAGAGGMEYPTLITTGGDWYWGHLDARVIESVTVHELGHQWFYGLVASNEHAFPFLDEGLNSYAETDALGAQYGTGSALDMFGLRLSGIALHRSFSATRALDEAIATPAADFASFRNLAAVVYSRTATLFETLARVYGKDAMRRALGDYARRHRFGHPKPDDLIRAAREVLGTDAARVLEQALFERGSVDFVASDLQAVRVSSNAGVFDRDGRRQTIRRDTKTTSDWVSRVVVYRRGTLVLPVEVDLHAADGTKVRRRWKGDAVSIVLTQRGSSPIVAAVVDPEHKVLIDQNLMNNAVTSRPGGTGRTAERAIYLAELLIGALGP